MKHIKTIEQLTESYRERGITLQHIKPIDFLKEAEGNDEEYDKLDKLAGEGAEMTDKQQEDYARLSAEHYPIKIEKMPGDVYSIATTGYGGNELQGSLLAKHYQKEIKEKVKNPKGLFMDLRKNDGGQQEPARAIIDFFVEGDETPLERQRDYWPDDSWTPKEKKQRYKETQNILKSKLKPEEKFTKIPVTMATSDWTFSGGEFTADTLKNLNKNVTHVGSNSGGGAHRTSPAVGYMNADLGVKDPNEKGISTEDKLNRYMAGFEALYVDKEKAQKIQKAIKDDPSKYIKDGKIDVKAVEQKMWDETGDFHVQFRTDDDGNIEVDVPYGGSDRIVADPKTGKVEGPPYKFKGNWEGGGTGTSIPGSGMTETDPEKAKHAALQLLYTKTGQEDQLEKMKNDPESFGITKDGKDSWYKRGTLEDREAGREHNYPGYAAQGEHPKLHAASLKAAAKNEKRWDEILKKHKEGKSIADMEEEGNVKSDIDLDQKIINPETDREIEVGTALAYGKDHKAYDVAKQKIKA